MTDVGGLAFGIVSDILCTVPESTCFVTDIDRNLLSKYNVIHKSRSVSRQSDDRPRRVH